MDPKRRDALVNGMLAENAMTDIATKLDKKGIRHMPLKGVLLFVTGCTLPQNRAISDIDVLVSSKSYTSAVEALLADGWEHQGKANTGDIFTNKRHALPLDFHHSLFPQGLYDLQTTQIFEQAMPLGKPWPSSTLAMNPLDLYAHLVGHFANSRFDARSNRVVDFETVASHFGIEANTCASHLDSLGLGRASRYALPFIAETHSDSFASEVLERLRPDRVGDAVSRATRDFVQGHAVGDRRAAWAAHAVNSSASKGAISLLAHFFGSVSSQMRRRLFGDSIHG